VLQTGRKEEKRFNRRRNEGEGERRRRENGGRGGLKEKGQMKLIWKRKTAPEFSNVFCSNSTPHVDSRTVIPIDLRSCKV
jgi:hypothetical protein